MYTAGGNGLPSIDADDRADAVGEQDLAQVVVVARRRGALDVVHRLGEVVDAERDRGGEQRRDVGSPAKTSADGQRQVQAELRERAATAVGFM